MLYISLRSRDCFVLILSLALKIFELLIECGRFCLAGCKIGWWGSTFSTQELTWLSLSSSCQKKDAIEFLLDWFLLSELSCTSVSISSCAVWGISPSPKFSVTFSCSVSNSRFFLSAAICRSLLSNSALNSFFFFLLLKRVFVPRWLEKKTRKCFLGWRLTWHAP